MQAIETSTAHKNGRRARYLLMAPVTAIVLMALLTMFVISGYRNQHDGLIFTGVTVGGVDLSKMTEAQAAIALADTFTYPTSESITLIHPITGQEWAMTPAELGLILDAENTIAAAYNVGRQGSPLEQIKGMFDGYYYGQTIAPVIVLDEAVMEAALHELAAEVNAPATDAAMGYEGETAVYTPAQFGQQLDVADTKARLLKPLASFTPARVELLVHDVQPAVADTGVAAEEIQQILENPLNFYVPEPLDEFDLAQIELPANELSSWLRVEMTTTDGAVAQHNLFVDENATRHWLRQFEETLFRDPVNARFYFDDGTEELVLVAPHINGRELDLDATVQAVVDRVGTADHSIPFVFTETIAPVSADANAAELGITELLNETTTWFYGSSDARKHNISRAAANFYGIVIAPGEEFSFNNYLGSISEDDGYTEGLIIVGGRTIKGVGGGTCQVSTTLYQTAFLSGFPITERWEHGTWLDYYNDGQGPGMDATIYTPIVDMKFINNTPHHLLLENYYNEELEALTFKFYSTSLGREVVKGDQQIYNETEVPGGEQDVWEFDPDMEPGTVEQIDVATQGADVMVDRQVFNADGDLILEETVHSHYIPYPNLYRYGPDVDPYSYNLVPPRR